MQLMATNIHLETFLKNALTHNAAAINL